MSSTAITQKQLEKIGDYIRERLPRWLMEGEFASIRTWIGADVHDRLVRVDEELKHQREIMIKGFEMMEKRIDQVDKRIDQVDRRMELMEKRLDRFMIWSLAFTMTMSGTIIAVLKFWK